MSDSSLPTTILSLVFGFLLFLSAYAAAQRRIRAAPEFALFMGSAAVYALGYCVELSRTDIASILLVIRYEYFGIASIPACWVLFAYRFSRNSRLSPAIVAALFAVPLLVLAAVWTNELHHLYYKSSWVRQDGPFPVFACEPGPIYWLNFAYIQACMVAGNVLLFTRARNAPPFMKRQAIVAFIGSIGPWIGNVLYIGGWIPWGLEPSSFFFALSGLCFSWALFKLGFLELIPAARDRAIEALRDGFLVLDSAGRVIDANEASGRLLGEWARREGREPPPEAPGGAELARLVEGGEPEAEIRLTGSDGKERRLAIQAFPVKGGSRAHPGRAMIIRDVTETTALLARLGELAGTDELTGLSNRRRFFEYAAREFSIAQREGRPLGVAILDIDHFKVVNDSFGHAAGDLVLREFSARLARALREADILCRYGGEEFAVLFPGADTPTALAAAERIREAATDSPVAWEGGALVVLASAGVYSAIPERSSRLDDFLSAADSALYEAKSMGRDRSVAREGAVPTRDGVPRREGD